MISARVLGVSLIALLLSVCVEHPRAYVTSGDRWNPAQIVLYLNPTTPDMSANQAEAAFQRAISIWNAAAVAEQVRLTYGGRTTDAVSQYDGRNIVWFNQGACGNIANTINWVWGNADGTRQIVDGDIELCDAYTFWPGEVDCPNTPNTIYLVSVLTHELGHILNLGHPLDHPEATMYPSAVTCDLNQVTLAQDDIDGLLFLYPVDPLVTDTATNTTDGSTSPKKGRGRRK